ncbi:MAG: hypothetical protein ISS36_01960 [Candidatus Aenigmarchaeota archaeon]|nr:hypothetical protein [Candidatus Aenigmarchaeota archaeon]
MQKRKAQARVFEEVILFLFGVMIFITFLAFYNSYQLYFLSVGEENQIIEIKNLVVSNIVKLATKPGDSSIIMKIPPKIGDIPYTIELSDTGILLRGSKMNTSNLYNIKELTGGTLGGSVWSTQGKVTIIKKENNINLV